MGDLPDDLLEPQAEGGEEPDVGEQSPSELDERGDDGIRGAEHLGLTPPD
ncbi:MAG: hypothetical protein M3229_03195 [Actinomycetota bacterium]|nr:hypothetical protein [Thermoleophilia bacterium]MDQ3992644.1 hypothetical protein [Actinomycetota bacterium]